MRNTSLILCVAVVLTTGAVTAVTAVAAERPMDNVAEAEISVSTMLRRMISLDHLPRSFPGETRMESTYDPRGGNASDGIGFKRIEGTSAILLETEGPGCIVRIANASTATKESGYLAAARTTLRVFIDHETTPVIDLPIGKLNSPGGLLPFSGTLPGFLVSMFPIPFAKHCRVELYNPDKPNWGAFWEVAYMLFPKETKVQSLRMPLSQEEAGLLQEANRVWQMADHWEKTREEPPATPSAWTVERAMVLSAGAVEEVMLPGSGIIRQMRVQCDPDDRLRLSGIRLKLFWDGSSEPAVDMPVGYFFGHDATGHRDQFRSLVMGVSKAFAYSFWPMPFSAGAKVRFENPTDKEVKLRLWLHVEPAPSDIAKLGRFRVTVNETPFEKGFANRDKLPAFGPLEIPDQPVWDLQKDGVISVPATYALKIPCHPVLDIQGKRGKYVGMFLRVDWDHEWWWGEGDPLIWTDDAPDWPPPYHGTGTETYFNSGWCRFGNWAASGIIRSPKMRPGPVGVYSFHLSDTFSFKKRFRFFLEIWPWGYNPEKGVANPALPQGFWRSTAYWYEFPKREQR